MSCSRILSGSGKMPGSKEQHTIFSTLIMRLSATTLKKDAGTGCRAQVEDFNGETFFFYKASFVLLNLCLDADPFR